jgi:deoxyribose-phosphate aldolase
MPRSSRAEQVALALAHLGKAAAMPHKRQNENPWSLPSIFSWGTLRSPLASSPMNELALTALAACIDHTLLKPEATAFEIDRLCAEAITHRFFSVCVHGSRVIRAVDRLDGSSVKVTCVVGFPLGAADGDVKRYETEVAVDHGASEIDMVMNIGRFKDIDYAAVLREIRDVVEAADERPVKVILETALLTPEEITKACQLAEEAGAKFVKTSTGFGPGGATLEAVKQMRSAVGPAMGVKASGGIRDFDTAFAMIQAGATRIGTSSGVAILRGIKPVPQEKT